MDIVENIKAMEPKQKVTLGVTILLFAFLIYYGFTTFFPSDDFSAPPTPTRQTTPPPPPSRTAVPKPTQTFNDPAGTTAAQKQPKDQVEKKPLDDLPPDQLKMIQESQAIQQQYLSLVSKYQIAQLQQKLAQTEVGLATAQLQSAKIQAQTQQLTGQLQQQQNQGPVITPEQMDQQKAQQQFSQVSVMFVAKQHGVWTAMLNASGSYFEVKVGTKLPDGSAVSQIDNRGVILTAVSLSRPLSIPKTLN